MKGLHTFSGIRTCCTSRTALSAGSITEALWEMSECFLCVCVHVRPLYTFIKEDFLTL